MGTTMKKVYSKPIAKKGLSLDSSILTSSGKLEGDGLSMDINSTGASSDAEGNQNDSFWDDEK